MRRWITDKISSVLFEESGDGRRKVALRKKKEDLSLEDILGAERANLSKGSDAKPRV